MISCLGDNEGCMHRLRGQQPTSKWKRINPQVRMREQEPAYLDLSCSAFSASDKNLCVLESGRAQPMERSEQAVPSPWMQSLSCCPYLGHSCLQHDVPHGQRRRVQHGDHHDQHIGAARRALPGKVQQDPEPVLVVGCHRQGTACHRERRERIQVHALRQHWDVWFELLIPLLNFMSFAKKLCL